MLPNSRIEAKLDSLQAVALTSPDWNERVAAIIGVGSPGRFWYITHPDEDSPPPEIRYPGIVARLGAIYTATENAELRSLIVRWMSLQAERDQAIDFLMAVAREDRPEDRNREWPVAVAAVDALAQMGTSGRAALQRLQAESRVQDPLVRARLNDLERRGWRLETPD